MTLKEENRDILEEYIKRADVLAKADYDANYRLIITAKDVRNIPRADVAEVKHGRWIPFLDGDSIMPERYYKCSKCGRVEEYKEPYCHCGAKMDGG